MAADAIELQRLADFRSERNETLSRRCARAGRPLRRSKRQCASNTSSGPDELEPALLFPHEVLMSDPALALRPVLEVKWCDHSRSTVCGESIGVP